MADEEHGPGLNRRQFVAGVTGILGGIMGAVIGLPGLDYVVAPAVRRQSADEWVPLGPVADLVDGEPTLFSFVRTQRTGWEVASSNYGAFVVKLSNDAYDVFSSKCTHLSCRLKWVPEDEQFECPCHDGRFAKDGAIISGPQPRPLDRFEHRVADGFIEVHIVEG